MSAQRLHIRFLQPAVLSFTLCVFREAMGVVLHKDSKWYQQWKDFKDNNVVFNSKNHLTSSFFNSWLFWYSRRFTIRWDHTEPYFVLEMLQPLFIGQIRGLQWTISINSALLKPRLRWYTKSTCSQVWSSMEKDKKQTGSRVDRALM